MTTYTGQAGVIASLLTQKADANSHDGRYTALLHAVERGQLFADSACKTLSTGLAGFGAVYLAAKVGAIGFDPSFPVHYGIVRQVPAAQLAARRQPRERRPWACTRTTSPSPTRRSGRPTGTVRGSRT